VYYLPRPVSATDLALMRRMDELHLEYPFMGTRMLRDQLNRKGFDVGRRHVGTLMKRMGIEALYRKPGTSKKHPGHEIYPYLLRSLAIDRANQVWALYDLHPNGQRLRLPHRRRGLGLAGVYWQQR
jgi:putative transposase